MFPLTRTRKRWIATTGVALIVFAHAAIAATGCLTNTMLIPESSCEDHQPATADTLICRTHLQTEAQTLDLAQLPQVLSFDSPVLILAPEQALAPARPGLPVLVQAPASGAPPPLNLLYSRSLT
jgi:hypothetical protein